MDFWEINIGDIILLGTTATGGIGVLVTMLVKFGVVLYRMDAIEDRVTRIEKQNVLPIERRSRVR